MAASTLAHGSAAWGSAAILAGLPSISGRGGDVTLEGPGSVEVVPLSPLGSGADKDHAGDPMSFVPIFHSESNQIEISQ
jgi:hypothetical protein